MFRDSIVIRHEAVIGCLPQAVHLSSVILLKEASTDARFGGTFQIQICKIYMSTVSPSMKSNIFHSRVPRDERFLFPVASGDRWHISRGM